jgi:maleamate amidohydrolase
MAWTLLPESVTLSFETPQPRSFTLEASKAAVIVVDMQNYFCKGRVLSTIEGTARLLRKARDAGVKVIFVQTVRQPGDEMLPHGVAPQLLDGLEETRILDDISPEEGEFVVRKRGPDPFARTELNDLLLRENILPTVSTIVVAGAWAEVSTNAACLGFSNRHYMTLIPMDCQAAATIEDEARTYAKYSENSYAFTLSSLIDFAPVGMTNSEIVAPPRRYEATRIS